MGGRRAERRMRWRGGRDSCVQNPVGHAGERDEVEKGKKTRDKK